MAMSKVTANAATPIEIAGFLVFREHHIAAIDEQAIEAAQIKTSTFGPMMTK
jgi:hypothetical protein